MNIMIILNYNDFFNTDKLVREVQSFSNLDKIIIVDNYSTDNSYEKIENLANDDTVVLRAKENRGYAAGNNIGIRYAADHFSVKNIVISNPDIIVKESTLNKLFYKLEEFPKVSAVSGIVCDINGNIVDNFAWKLPTYFMMLQNTSVIITKLLMSLGISRFYEKKNLHSTKIVDVLSGCFFIIKAEVFSEVGYFDEDSFLYNEENILFYKLKNLGYSQLILCEETIIHIQGTSINKNIRSFFQKRNTIKHSEQVYLEKYLDINKAQMLVYNICFFIGSLEKYLIAKLKNVRRRKN
ncbi:glycosyltransferase family 2 protein [Enterococcus sp. BWT-B8]|uniref:glycosyltransferase n=1 Tax=Enterococcus sp. BWT-B8 TaxID=2885157 RepID=UPI001E60A6BA|nr:glycosyltransferase family 2 protein [Enterococcus sp. BWT-B8]MCB5951538.1 glycosyltransferase family 2 protein [Enterococcus sp. BWT-B8]